jgi:hypothetical protein
MVNIQAPEQVWLDVGYASNLAPMLALKIARYFGRHADEIFQLEEND